jgi:predicted enzyme related to lactoylglutathione lyase
MAKKKAKKAARSKASKRAARRPAARKPARKAKPAAKKRPVAKPKAAKPAPMPVFGDVRVTRQHLDFTTHSPDDVKRFYTETLGLKDFTYYPDWHYLMVKTAGGSTVGFMPPMENMPPDAWMPPKEPTLMFYVKDVDQAYKLLVGRGVQIEAPPEDMAWGDRVVKLRDPEGRAVWLGTPIKK